MPEPLLRPALAELGPDCDVEDAILKLSKAFEVSKEAMTIRLTRLGWITE